MEMPAITDDLLAEIFLRLPNPADVALARARAACVSFRRVASDRSFILRYRKLHGRPLLGLVDKDGFHPVLPPHPSAPAARALSAAADFSFSFLPSPGSWAIKDAHDGRFLLDRAPEGQETPKVKIVNELAVCDPLHRRFLLLPAVPDDLLAHRRLVHPFSLSGPFLAPAGETAAAEETSFRLIWMVRCETKPVALVFSSCSGRWRAAGSRSWSDALAVKDAPRFGPHVWLTERCYAYGCFYWEVLMDGRLLVLDTLTMEFSIDLPPTGRDVSKGEIGIVEAGEGVPWMFQLHYETGDLYYAVKQNNQWQALEKICVLDSEYIYSIAGATERYLLLIRELEDRPLASSTPEVPHYGRVREPSDFAKSVDPAPRASFVLL